MVTSPSFSVMIMVFSGSAARAANEEANKTANTASAEASFQNFIEYS